MCSACRVFCGLDINIFGLSVVLLPAAEIILK